MQMATPKTQGRDAYIVDRVADAVTRLQRYPNHAQRRQSSTWLPCHCYLATSMRWEEGMGCMRAELSQWTAGLDCRSACARGGSMHLRLRLIGAACSIRE
eukprot:4753899-Pleurochrysis_carterae.AAC.4